jgi:hypothetical protein
MAKEKVHRLGDDRRREHDVVVADQRDARIDGVAAQRRATGEPVPIADRIVR